MRARGTSPGAPGQSGFLGIAMFAPAVLFIVFLIAVPFGLAVLYAFSDARIGSTGFHFVGLENFRSILQSPSFRKALRNSIVFTLCAQVIVIDHDVELIRAMCTETLVLDYGRRLALGPTEAVLADPEVRKAYLGEA